MKSDITVILTLYKTPKSKIKKLKQYKNFKTILFDQDSDGLIKNEIKKILNFNFKYYFSSKNIGLSKSSNFLLSKVKTKYCLFTQPDILIDEKSINLLKKTINIRRDVIFVAPTHNKKTKSKKLNNLPKYTIVRNLKAACMLCDVNKLKKIGFFDDDFFLYWEDADLCRRLRATGDHVRYVQDATAIHRVGQSNRTARADVVRAFHASAFLYYSTHVASKPFDLKRLLARAILNVRCFLVLIRQRFRRT